jgi:chain length determinant protein EpsF
MSLSQFLLILGARRKLLLATMATILLLTLVASLALPKVYKASASVLLNPGIDPVTGQALPGQLVPSYLATQLGILQSRALALQVVEQLKLEQRPQFQSRHDSTLGRDRVADAVLKKFNAKPGRDSNVVELVYADPDPRWAAAIVNAWARDFQRMNMDLRLEPARQASTYFEEQLRRQRAALDEAQQRTSAWQQKKGIANVDEKLDAETLRLKELTTQLVTVQNQLLEARSRQTQAEGEGGVNSNDVLANPMIQNLRVALATAESKFAQVAEKFTENHPRYIEAQAEVARLKAELRANSKNAASGMSRAASATRERELALERAVQAQKARVLALNRDRDELQVMQKEVESRQKAYDGLLQKQAQTVVEAGSRQSEVTLLSAAVPPAKAAFPRLTLNLACALLLGLLLGIGLALLAELRDRRIRSSNDLLDVLQAPVLGSIRWGKPSQSRLPAPHWLLPQPSA